MVKKKRKVTKTSKKKVQPAEAKDFGTPELHQRLNTRRKNGRAIVMNSTALEYYHNMKRGGITQRQYEAGTQLERDFYFSGLSPSMTPCLDPCHIPSGNSERGMLAKGEKQWHHYRRFQKAMDSLAIPDAKMLAFNVCCGSFFVKELQHPYFNAPSALLGYLRVVLDTLAEFYKIPR